METPHHRADGEILGYFQPRVPFLTQQRTHSKTGSTLRLIYHSRILRLRTELYFWLGEKVSLNKSDVLIVYHQDYGNDNKQDCD